MDELKEFYDKVYAECYTIAEEKSIAAKLQKEKEANLDKIITRFINDFKKLNLVNGLNIIKLTNLNNHSSKNAYFYILEITSLKVDNLQLKLSMTDYEKLNVTIKDESYNIALDEKELITALKPLIIEAITFSMK